MRSLSRFRSVSESWNSLILDPFFRRSHHPRTRILIANEDTDTYSSLDLSNATLISIDSTDCLNLRCRDPFPSSSCRGLICFYLNTSQLCVFNPATGEYLKSPESYLYSSTHVLGFAYIASAGEYKILCKVTQPRIRDEEHRYCLFSFGGKLGMSWRAVKGNLLLIIEGLRTATVKGVVYMLHKCFNITKDNVRFDMEAEEWSVMPRPPGGEWRKYAVIGIQGLRGSLCYTCYSWEHETLDMWILKDCDVWEEFKIDISIYTLPNGLGVEFPLRPLVIDNNGRILFQSYLTDEDDCWDITGSHIYDEENRCKLVYYCPKSKMFEDVYRNENPYANLILPYDETFASPFGDVSTT